MSRHPASDWEPPSPPHNQQRPEHKQNRIVASVVGGIAAAAILLTAAFVVVLNNEEEHNQPSAFTDLRSSSENAIIDSRAAAYADQLESILVEMSASAADENVPALRGACSKLVDTASEAKGAPYPTDIGGASQFKAAMTAFWQAGSLCKQALLPASSSADINPDLVDASTKAIENAALLMKEATAAVLASA